MSSFILRLTELLLWPIYFVLLLVAGLLQEADLANWAARRLGLQGVVEPSEYKGSGVAGLVGLAGQANTDFRDGGDGSFTGKVLVRGEIWNGRTTDGVLAIKAGERVRVVAAEGLTLIVEPAQSSR